MEGAQALAHLAQAKAVARLGRALRVQPQAVVAHLQAQALAVQAGAYMDAAAFDLGLQAMLNAVFHQRLQQQRRHARRAQCLGQLQRELQARPHAHCHQFQVVAHALKLLLQRMAGRARGA